MTPIAELNEQLNDKRPKDILKKAFEQFDNIAISFSGAEDVVLIDMAVKIRPDVAVFTLDTGRLHPETYQFIDTVRDHYGIDINVFSPQHEALQEFVSRNGMFSFYRDGHEECCGIRKIEPLRRALAGVDAWITGQRKDQSPGTRSDISVVEADTTFSGAAETLTKFNPLANWSSQQVWEYIKVFEVPYNSLHEQGFKSIGCQPCTRPTLPNQHEREGRWWWEGDGHKECGLHAGNILAKD